MERMIAAVRGYKGMKGTESSNDERMEWAATIVRGCAETDGSNYRVKGINEKN